MKSRWSVQVARVGGVPIRIHATFLLLVAWVALAHWSREPDLRGVALAVVFLLVVFGLIVVHELSHSLVARAFGVRTRDITLWPVGGVSSLERMPEHPVQELLIALAGPAVNVVVAAGLGWWVVATAGWEALRAPELTDVPVGFAAALVRVNVALALFNLLPAFPMDGGRALRAVLALGMDRVQATRAAASAARVMAALFAVAGLLFNPFLVLIAALVWLGAGAEAAHTELEAALAPHTVDDVMDPAPPTLEARETLGRAAQLHIQAGRSAYPVLADGQVVGVLGELDLLRGLAAGGAGAPVGDHLGPTVVRVRRRSGLQEAFRRLLDTDAPCALVEDEAGLAGVVTRPAIGALLAVTAALRGELPRGAEREPAGARR